MSAASEGGGTHEQNCGWTNIWSYWPPESWKCLRQDYKVDDLETKVTEEQTNVLIAAIAGPLSGVAGGILLSYLSKPLLGLFKKGI